ncbi:MAG: hypothetical protein WA445_07855 [Pseudolabrys sp.]
MATLTRKSPARAQLEPFLKPEFAVCPPPDMLSDNKDILAQMILSITAYLKSHPEQRSNNFHQTALTALVAAWPCSKYDRNVSYWQTQKFLEFSE